MSEILKICWDLQNPSETPASLVRKAGLQISCSRQPTLS